MPMPKTIEGVQIIGIKSHDDERGFFREVYKKSAINVSARQVSLSLTKPGIIKAFHWHNSQFDIWHLVSGRALVVLYDIRKNSATAGLTMSFVMDETDPKLIVIPKKVAHGYKALGKGPMLMLYIMDREYNRKKPDEWRMDFDDKRIGFNWESEK